MLIMKNFDIGKIRTHARELRVNMTISERLLWEVVRGRRLNGFKFLRQHPILYGGNLLRYNYFIADFYCNEKKAIIELDGPIHDNNGEYDLFRDSELKHLGYNILRLKNEELNDIKSTKARILAFLDSINEE